MTEPIHTFELYYHEESHSYQDKVYQESDTEEGVWLCRGYVQRLLPSNIIRSPQVTLNVYAEEKQHCFEFKINKASQSQYDYDGGIDLPALGVGIELSDTVVELAAKLNLIGKTLYGEFV